MRLGLARWYSFQPLCIEQLFISGDKGHFEDDGCGREEGVSEVGLGKMDVACLFGHCPIDRGLENRQGKMRIGKPFLEVGRKV